MWSNPALDNRGRSVRLTSDPLMRTRIMWQLCLSAHSWNARRRVCRQAIGAAHPRTHALNSVCSSVLGLDGDYGQHLATSPAVARRIGHSAARFLLCQSIRPPARITSICLFIRPCLTAIRPKLSSVISQSLLSAMQIAPAKHRPGENSLWPKLIFAPLC